MRNPFLAVQMICRGLKCDTPGCEFIDPDIPLNPRTIRENLNRPCPQCGASLLTPEDAKTTLNLLWFTGVINVIAFPFMVLFSPAILAMRLMGRPTREQFRCKFDGTGRVVVKQINPEEKP